MSERIKWVSHVAYTGEIENAHRILVMKLGDLGINGSIILMKDLKG
jgi:hypothetical protein